MRELLAAAGGDAERLDRFLTAAGGNAERVRNLLAAVGGDAGRLDGLLRAAGGSADRLERLLAASGDNAARLEGLLGQTGGDGVQLDELFRVTNGNGWTVSARAGPGPIDNALRHFADHGAEFGARDPLDYVRQAQDFLRNPPGSALSRVRPNGDVVRFDPTTDTFGVMDANGAPRTMFKPDPAVHGYPTNLDYFNAQ